MVIPLTAGGSAPADPLALINSQQRTPVQDRPYVLSNMVSSMDGAIAVDGLSGGLGGPADVTMFMALRSVADVIIVGAGTVRDERYKPPQPGETALGLRRGRNQSDRPLVAVVTSSGRLPQDLPLFSDPTYRPLIIAGADPDQDALDRIADLADIERTTSDSVGPEEALSVLHKLGHRIALLEGGPRLNGAFVEADCVDEWNLTISPNLVGGTAGRASRGESGVLNAFVVEHVLTADGLIFVQWRRQHRA
ncbi:MAG: dihydrofolate reductase family protein [Acidimicrobiales bacterium]